MINDRIQRLTTMATQLRRDVVNAVYYAKDGHPGPCMSAADIIAALYFDMLRLKPDEPDWPGRDRFILSKGHACPVLYAALARRGYFLPSELKTLRFINSRLQGHPDMKKTPGIDVTAGSLGHGLSQACGMALASRRYGSDNLIFVLTGDGELEEGIIWEAAMSASKYKLSNIIMIVDNNAMQSGGHVNVVGGLYPLHEKFEAFGWIVEETDGHDMEQLISVLEKTVKNARNSLLNHSEFRPQVIIAHTIKGKGVPFMEHDNSWHKRVPNDNEYQLAMSILGGLDLE